MPHAEIEPLAVSAANALPVENTCVKPVTVGAGAPKPPVKLLPHAEIEPSALSAAKAPLVENTFVKLLPAGAAPMVEAPQETSEPSLRKAVKPLAEDQTSTKLFPVGLPLPPLAVFPHTAMLPLRFSAA